MWNNAACFHSIYVQERETGEGQWTGADTLMLLTHGIVFYPFNLPPWRQWRIILNSVFKVFDQIQPKVFPHFPGEIISRGIQDCATLNVLILFEVLYFDQNFIFYRVSLCIGLCVALSVVFCGINTLDSRFWLYCPNTWRHYQNDVKLLSHFYESPNSELLFFHFWWNLIGSEVWTLNPMWLKQRRRHELLKERMGAFLPPWAHWG